MTFIKNVDFSKFLINQDFALHSLILTEVQKLSHELLNPTVSIYNEKFTLLDAALKQGGKNALTQQLATLDGKRDKVYTGAAAHVRNMLNHFDEQKAAIAYEVSLIFDKYGNPTRLAYLQEGAVLVNLIADLRVYDNVPTEPEEDEPVVQSTNEVHNRLSLIGLSEWIDQLEAINNEFTAVYATRNEEQGGLVTGATGEARKEADNAYYAVARRINSLVDLYGEADFLIAVNNINQLIEKEEATLAAHRTKIANAKKEDTDGGDTPTPDTPTPDAPPADDEPVVQ